MMSRIIELVLVLYIHMVRKSDKLSRDSYGHDLTKKGRELAQRLAEAHPSLIVSHREKRSYEASSHGVHEARG